MQRKHLLITFIISTASLAQSRNSSGPDPEPVWSMERVPVRACWVQKGRQSDEGYGYGYGYGIIACCSCQWLSATSADVVGRKHVGARLRWSPYSVFHTPRRIPYSTVTGPSSHTSNCNQHLGNEQLGQKKKKNATTDVFIYKAARNSRCVLSYILTPDCRMDSAAQASGFKSIGK